MQGSFIGKQLARTNRNLLVTNLVLIAFLAFLFYANAKYMVNFFRGTAPISAYDLGRLRSLDERFRTFVQVQGEESHASGIQGIEETRDQYSSKVESQTVKSEFKYLLLGNRVLVVKAEPGTPDTVTTFRGELVPVPADVREAVIDPQVKEDPLYADVFLPFMLDTVDYKTSGYWAIGLGAPTLLLCLWNLKKWIVRTQDPASHPIYKRLAQYGVPDIVIQEFEGASSLAAKFGDTTIAGPWITQSRPYSFSFIKLDEVLWVYKKVTKNSVNFIPTGKTYNTLIFDRRGTTITMSGKEAAVNSFMVALGQAIPWAIFGFQAELQTIWSKNRADMAAAVDERKKQLTAKTANAGS